jgi:hypothetical protein
MLSSTTAACGAGALTERARTANATRMLAYLSNFQTEDTSFNAAREGVIFPPISQGLIMRASIAPLIIFLVPILTSLAACAAPTDKLSFSPARGITAEVTTNGQQVTVAVKKGNEVTVEKIQVETEKNLKLIAADYKLR